MNQDLKPWTHSGQSNKTLFMDLKSLTPKDLIYIQPNENGGQITDLIYIYIYIYPKEKRESHIQA